MRGQFPQARHIDSAFGKHHLDTLREIFRRQKHLTFDQVLEIHQLDDSSENCQRFRLIAASELGGGEIEVLLEFSANGWLMKALTDA